MFLTKKTTGAPKQKTKNSKALGGWDDEDDADASPQLQYTNTNTNANTNTKYNKNEEKVTQDIDLLNGVVPDKNNTKQQKVKAVLQTANNKKVQIDQLYTSKQLNTMKNIECQKKLIQDLITPSGIRIKPSDNLLAQFLSEAKLLQIPIISSILISHLYSTENVFQKKARTLYAIEYLAKKNIQYSVYFKLHSQTIKNSPSLSIQEEDHRQNYDKIKKNLLGTLGTVVVRPQERQEGEEAGKSNNLEYVDPGYNTKEQGVLGLVSKKSQPTKQKPVITKKLISPSQLKTKKPLQGPGSKAHSQKPEQQDLLSAGRTGIPKQASKQLDLLQVSDTGKQKNLIEFLHNVPNNSINGDFLI